MSSSISKLPYIIAIDFDGTLVENKFPDIGETKRFFDTIKLVRVEKPEVKVILWTCRTGEYLQNAILFCKENGLVFDEVNKNIPEVIAIFGEDTRKVYADEYWDDKVPFENWFVCHGV